MREETGLQLRSRTSIHSFHRHTSSPTPCRTLRWAPGNKPMEKRRCCPRRTYRHLEVYSTWSVQGQKYHRGSRGTKGGQHTQLGEIEEGSLEKCCSAHDDDGGSPDSGHLSRKGVCLGMGVTWSFLEKRGNEDGCVVRVGLAVLIPCVGSQRLAGS